MKKVKLLYNPMSGNRRFPDFLDDFIDRFQRAGYEVSVFRSLKPGDIPMGLENIVKDEYDAIVAAGGDGTVNEVINKMLEDKIDVPLGIVPAGTANDFAVHLNMPSEFRECFDTILKGKVKEVDVGKVNGRYFINVCAGGLLSTVSHEIDRKFKNTLGKMAYYLKGIEQLPRLKPIPLKIITKEKRVEEEIYLFLILNSQGAGGFNKLAPLATIDDGLLEFVAIKARPLHEMAALFVKVLQGEHLNDKNIIYLQDNYFKVECTNSTYDPHFSDVDGEKGPHLPLEISLEPRKLRVFANI